MISNCIEDVHDDVLEPNKKLMSTFMWWIDEPSVKGSRNPSDADLRGLRAQGFSVAVSLLEESKQPPSYDKKSAEGNGWSIHSIPIAENLAPSLEQIRDFVMRLTRLLKGTKVLVFCQSGRGRTACMGAAYWIAKGLTASVAIDLMSERCGDTKWPTPERCQVLGEYERSMNR
jgi:protein-tyrosine phosphatase